MNQKQMNIKNNLLIISALLLSCSSSTTESIPDTSITINMQDIQPTLHSSQTDFDFYTGKWKIKNKKLKKIFDNCKEWTIFDAEEEVTPILLGLGFLGRYSAIRDNAPFEGTAIHLFNPQTKLWSNYWADSKNGTLEVPVIGSFEKHTALFYANDTFKEKPIRIRFRWDISDKDNPVWEQAFSDDNGKTWEVNWIMYYSRVK